MYSYLFLSLVNHYWKTHNNNIMTIAHQEHLTDHHMSKLTFTVVNELVFIPDFQYWISISLNINFCAWTFMWKDKCLIILVNTNHYLHAFCAHTWQEDPLDSLGWWGQAWGEGPSRDRQHASSTCSSSGFHQCPNRPQLAPQRQSFLQHTVNGTMKCLIPIIYM